MGKNPEVSIIIRVKNEALHLDKVLKSLFQQTYKNFEIIVIDSGSKDNTLKIVKRYSVKLLRIKPNEFGYSRTINFGIRKSKGSYIAILSGHSLPVSDKWLENGVKTMRDEKIAGLSGPYSMFPLGYLSRILGRIFFKASDFRRIDHYPWLTNTNSLVRKKRWDEYCFDESLDKEGCEDYDWALEMFSRGFNIVKDPGFAVFHSHFLLGKPGYFDRLPQWKITCKRLEGRKRPSKNNVNYERWGCD